MNGSDTGHGGMPTGATEATTVSAPPPPGDHSSQAEHGIDGIVGIIILVILAWQALRDYVIVAFDLNFESGPLSYIFPQVVRRRELKRTITDTLDQLGLNQAFLTRVRSANRVAVGPTRQDLAIPNDTEALRQLVRLLARHTITLPQPSVYGHKTTVRTSFYINTLEAALDKDECILMSRLIIYLISRDGISPDYILSSKMGNAILANVTSDRTGMRCVLRKPANDRSRLKGGSRNAIEVANFEGASGLLQAYVDLTQPAEGVLVDCNCSGGSALMEAATEFAAVASQAPHITSPTRMYVLFRPDEEPAADQQAKANGLSLRRYFDLDEDLKAQLASLSVLVERHGPQSDAINGKIDALLAEIRKRGLMKIDE